MLSVSVNLPRDVVGYRDNGGDEMRRREFVMNPICSQTALRRLWDTAISFLLLLVGAVLDHWQLSVASLF